MKKILIVDDDLDLQRLYSEKLGMSGFEVRTAANSDQASEFIETWDPSLVLLDIMIPGKMNGLEVLAKLRGNDKTKKVKVVVLTNLDNQKEDALKSGADDYYVKANLSLNELVEKIKALVG